MTAASWQSDPSGRHEMRWWDGQRWTDHVNDSGVTSLDPLSAVPPPTVAQQPIVQQQQTMHSPITQPPTMQQPAAQYPPTQNPPTQYLPTVAQPTMAQPMYEQQWSGAAAPPPNRVPWIIGGVVAVIAIGVGAAFVLKSDDKPSSTSTVTTAPDTSLVDTTLPQESTTVAPSSTVPQVVLDGQAMVGLLPTDSDVPVEWTRALDADPAPQSQSGPGLGFCGGANSVGRAQLAGSTGVAYGPSWDLPDKSVFYADMYAFPSDAEAADFITAILKDANACPDSPVQYSLTEADAGWFDDASLADTVWAVEERAGASKESDTKADEAAQAFVDEHYSCTVDTTDYTVDTSTLIIYERWGNVVISYSLYGRFAYTGWSSPSEFEHQPTHDELLTAADIVRNGIVTRLHDAGVI